jgi:hypothetical protein
MTANRAHYVEKDCRFTFQGRTFESGGAIVKDEWIIAYPGKDGRLNDWHGQQIGTYNILSTWRTPRSFVSSTMSSIECLVNGIRYVGRGAGIGMILRAKRSPRQVQ